MLFCPSGSESCSSVGSSSSSLSRPQLPLPVSASSWSNIPSSAPLIHPAADTRGPGHPEMIKSVPPQPPSATDATNYYVLPLEASGIPPGSVLVNPHTGGWRWKGCWPSLSLVCCFTSKFSCLVIFWFTHELFTTQGQNYRLACGCTRFVHHIQTKKHADQNAPNRWEKSVNIHHGPVVHFWAANWTSNAAKVVNSCCRSSHVRVCFSLCFLFVRCWIIGVFFDRQAFHPPRRQRCSL